MTNVYTASTYIDANPAEVFEYVRVPENQPDWARTFVRSTRPAGEGRYVMETPGGSLTYRVEADPHRGTVDFIFEGPQGENLLPARVVPQGEGSIFTFTITRTPGMDDEAWEAGRRGMDEELAHLKRLLES
jgi:hypothetical protein